MPRPGRKLLCSRYPRGNHYLSELKKFSSCDPLLGRPSHCRFKNYEELCQQRKFTSSSERNWGLLYIFISLLIHTRSNHHNCLSSSSFFPFILIAALKCFPLSSWRSTHRNSVSRNTQKSIQAIVLLRTAPWWFVSIEFWFQCRFLARQLLLERSSITPAWNSNRELKLRFEWWWKNEWKWISESGNRFRGATWENIICFVNWLELSAVWEGLASVQMPSRLH